MNYSKIYNELMDRAKNRVLNEYCEKHHILPRCLGGLDISDNIVTLTAKEHYIAHRLLVELYPSNNKIRYAFWMMCTMNTDSQFRYKVSSRAYEYAKRLISTKTNEHKQKISESLKAAYASGKRTKKTGVKMPESFGQAISAAKKGMIGTNKGIPMSEEQKYKISETLKNKPLLKCPHCDRESRGTSFVHYHFENCKFKKS